MRWEHSRGQVFVLQIGLFNSSNWYNLTDGKNNFNLYIMSDILPILSGIKRDMEVLTRTVAQMSKTHAQQLNEEWLIKEQVMAILKISARTLETLKKKGILSYTKIQGMFYYSTADIEKLLKENYVKNGSIKGSGGL